MKVDERECSKWRRTTIADATATAIPMKYSAKTMFCPLVGKNAAANNAYTVSRAPHDIKGDIYDIKDDIHDIKGDTGVTPIVKKRNRTVKETLGAEVATSTSPESPDWFNVLSSLERFDQSFEICQDWVGKHGVPEVLAQRLAYSLKDWLSRQQAGSKALRGDPWTRFTAWVVRDLTEAPSDAGGADKYLVAQDEAKRRGK